MGGILSAAQLTLVYPLNPGFKRRGTSSDAARAISKRAPSLKEKAFSVLLLAMAQGRTGATADEVARELGETEFSIRPRLSELVKAGLIEDSGITHKNTSGHSATVWRVKSI